MEWVHRLRRRSADDRGVTAVEYGLIIAGAGLAAIAGFVFFQGALEGVFNDTSEGTGTEACATANCDAIGTLPNADFTRTGTSTTPTVLATGVTLLTATSATLNGSVTANGAAVAVSFCVRTDTAVGSCTWTTATTPVSGSVSDPGPVSVSLTASSLTPNTSYNYWVKATRGGTDYVSASSPFITLNNTPTTPTVITAAEGVVTSDSGVMNGSVTANGAAVAVSFCVRTDTAVGSCTWTTATTPVSGSVSDPGPVSVSLTASSLLPNTTYNYWVKATRGGTDYISPTYETFTTSSGTPVVATAAEGAVTSSSGVMNGSVTANGAAVTVSFCIKTGSTSSTGCTWTTATTPVSGSVSGTTATPVSLTASSLLPNTTYNYWVKATRGGTDYISPTYETFTTPLAACQVDQVLTKQTNMAKGDSRNVLTLAGVTGGTLTGFDWSNNSVDVTNPSGANLSWTWTGSSGKTTTITFEYTATTCSGTGSGSVVYTTSSS